MATKAELTIVAHPDWTSAQRTFFFRLKESLPILMSYLTSEIPVLDNLSDKALVDEVGVVKQIKKTAEKCEKAHVERLKARLGEKDELMGDAYHAQYRGGERIILNQEACREFIEKANEMEIHLGRLLAAIESKQVQVPNNVFLNQDDPQAPEFNNPDFFTSAKGGRSLYVEPIQ